MGGFHPWRAPDVQGQIGSVLHFAPNHLESLCTEALAAIRTARPAARIRFAPVTQLGGGTWDGAAVIAAIQELVQVVLEAAAGAPVELLTAQSGPFFRVEARTPVRTEDLRSRAAVARSVAEGHGGTLLQTNADDHTSLVFNIRRYAGTSTVD